MIDAIYVRDLWGHCNSFTNAAICTKRGRKWWIEFRGHGFPVGYKTKRDACEQVERWKFALLERFPMSTWY